LAVHARQPHVEEHEVELLPAEPGEGPSRVPRRLDRVARRAELQADQVAGRAVVVDDEDGGVC
jgi:hypothetical protein